MNWQSRLEKTVIALNLVGLALGFGTLGILILVKGERAGGSLISGTLGIVVGSLFLLFAFYFCKYTRGGGDRKAGNALKDDLKKERAIFAKGGNYLMRPPLRPARSKDLSVAFRAALDERASPMINVRIGKKLDASASGSAPQGF